MSLPFGIQVRTTHEIIRLKFGDGRYGTAYCYTTIRDRQRYSQPEALLLDDPLAGLHDDGWPGTPVFDPVPEDATAHISRLRRFPRQATGVVIGRVWKHEGRAETGVTTFDGAERYFQPNGNKARLYEVAVEPGAQGAMRVILAHPDDVKEEE